jgi:hypothetical protein
MARRISSLRPGLLSLLVGALMLRLLVPAGWMFAPGAPTLVLCDGAAPAPAVHLAHGHHHPLPHDPARHPQEACPYAALAAPILPPLPPLVVPPAGRLEAASAPLGRTASAAVAPAAPPPPATGPPVTA